MQIAYATAVGVDSSGILMLKMSRRAILRVLPAFLAMRLVKPEPHAASGEVVEINGWILRRSDLT